MGALLSVVAHNKCGCAHTVLFWDCSFVHLMSDLKIVVPLLRNKRNEKKKMKKNEKKEKRFGSFSY